jgi:hypothetical protein
MEGKRTMATKLNNLRITRVDLVDRGANFDKNTGQGAHVVICKRADDEEKPSYLDPERVAKDAGALREYRRRYFQRVNS